MNRLVLGTALVVVLGLIALLLAAALGIFPRRDDPIATEVSLAAAESAEEKLERLISDNEEVRLSAVELTSLFHYRPEAWKLGLPLLEPSAAMMADTLVISGRVQTSSLPSQPILVRVRMFLPDTADVKVAGTVSSIGRDKTVLNVLNVEVAGMPVPTRLIADAIGHLDSGLGGQSESAVLLPLPDGISAARVERGELLLIP
jgi:hypothetical protein